MTHLKKFNIWHNLEYFGILYHTNNKNLLCLLLATFHTLRTIFTLVIVLHNVSQFVYASVFLILLVTSINVVIYKLSQLKGENKASVLYTVTIYGLLFIDTRRYGPLRGPTSSSCEGLRPRLFLPFWQKKYL